MTKISVKPCANCGGRVKIASYEDHSGSYRWRQIVCGECGMRSPESHYSRNLRTKAEADAIVAAVWNRRVGDD